jgi:hypothetical protein
MWSVTVHNTVTSNLSTLFFSLFLPQPHTLQELTPCSVKMAHVNTATMLLSHYSMLLPEIKLMQCQDKKYSSYSSTIPLSSWLQNLDSMFSHHRPVTGTFWFTPCTWTTTLFLFPKLLLFKTFHILATKVVKTTTVSLLCSISFFFLSPVSYTIFTDVLFSTNSAI